MYTPSGASGVSKEVPSLQSLCISVLAQQVSHRTDYSKFPKKVAILAIKEGKPSIDQLQKIEELNTHLGADPFPMLWKAFCSKNLGESRKPPTKTWKEHFMMLQKVRERKKKKYRLRGRSSETAKAHRG
eukprot:TRINITY_DN3752_c0_g2_i1.p1 TRINITY_DN3752_c0_g2~~TRINITY_DN3752_c0_g2_i1.p1  ORF type:complete len:129 (-),score=29.35 TRINITY_DN3752_c0_g2_i1:2-388(-)